MSKNTDKVTFLESLRLHRRVIPVMNRYFPGYFPVMVLHNMIAALAPYVTICFSAMLIDEIAGLRRPNVIFFWAIITVLAGGITAVIKAVFERWKKTKTEMLFDQEFKIFTDKILSMDFLKVDERSTSDLLNQIHQNKRFAACGIMRAAIAIDKGVSGFFGIAGAAILGAGAFTLPAIKPQAAILNHPLVILCFFVLFCVSVAMGPVLVGKVNQYYINTAENGKLSNRVFHYYEAFAVDLKKQMDVRMYRQERFAEHYERITRGSRTEVVGPMGVYGGFAKSMGAISTAIIYIFVCLKAWAGAFGVGSATRYISAISELSKNINVFLEAIGDMKANGQFMKTVCSFLDISNMMYQGTLPTEKRMDREYDVEFRDVSFKYPGSDLWALRHVNMKFKVGKRLAIVGENGSGKTTFIKLLCRLYDPQEGQILLNGIDIRKYNYRDYMDVFSIVFQDFQLLSQPLGNNVAGASEYDAERVTQALVDAGFGDRLAELPDGLETMLYKDFGENGVEVSGGEAQKIAIARALYKDAPFIILDEPTASLDPIAEAEIYAKFNDISGDKTAIYISHRLSSCKFCDEIAVFHEGAVIQQGTHAELVADETGKYHELWNAQAQYYTEKTA